MFLQFHWMQRIHWSCNNIGMVDMATALEDAGIISVLLPYGPGGNDFTLHLPDVFRATQKIKMMIAVGAYAVSPEYIAKTFYSVQDYGPNRLSLNLVAGRYNDHFEEIAKKYYHLDSNLIDSHKKRVAITEKWMKNFVELIKNEPYEVDLAVVGTSPTTIKIANLYTKYIFVPGITEIKQITNSEPILVIDPLILEDGQDESEIEYHNYEFNKKPEHPFKGTHNEVKEQLIDIANQFNIKNFLIHTDQKDISKLLKLVKDMSGDL